MKTMVILNPYAGRWSALQRKPDAEQALHSAGIDYELVMTEGPEHGTRLAAQAVKDGYQRIIAAGGDGSISEVVNGMMAGMSAANQDAGQSVLGILPLGTANDLVINLGLPVDLAAAAQVIAAGHTRRLDLGEVQVGLNGPRRFFDNNSAIGLEPTVTLVQQDITWLRGVVRYLLATLIAVMRKPEWRLKIDWEGGSYQGMATLVTVGNTPLTGGLFYMTPDADPFDGKLTFVYGYMPTRRQILQLLPRTMKPRPGSYVEHPSIHQVHSSWLKIEVETGTPVHADGEIQSKDERHFYYQVKPGCLPVFLPESASAPGAARNAPSG